MGLNHMREERKMSYLYGVATERRFAQEIRVFGTQEYLIDKYRRVWNSYFSNKYIYDLNKNSLIKVPDAVYAYLKDMAGEADTEVGEYLEDL